MNKQYWEVEVQLEKAKKAIQLLFVLSLIAAYGIYSIVGFEMLTYIQLVVTAILFISGQIIFKYPFFSVIVLAIVVAFYLWGWIAYFIFPTNSFGINTSNIFGIINVFYRIFITGVAIGGLYFAIKGMNAKEHFEKNHGTLDEDEL